MNKLEYFNACKSHDWLFDMSDDHSVYKRGQLMQDKLYNLAKHHDELYPIFKAWNNYISYGFATGEYKNEPQYIDF